MAPVDRGGIPAGRHQARLRGCIGERAFPFPGDDSISDRDYTPLMRVLQTAVQIAVMKNALEVETSAPDGVISMPGAFEIRVVAERAGATREQCAGAGDCVVKRPRVVPIRHIQHIYPRALQPRAAGVTIPAAPVPALAVMRQILLVAVNAHHI